MAVTTKYTMYHTTVLDTDPDAVWAEVRDLVRNVKILFGDAAEDVRWVEDGTPERVPSRYEFTMLPGRDLVQLEVFARDEMDRSIGYRTVAPVQCLYNYVASYRVVPVTNDPGRGFMEYRREFMITDDADPEVVDAFVGMMENQINVLRDYFAKPGTD